MQTRTIDILLWSGVVALDVTGPMDVFRLADALHPQHPYRVRLIGEGEDAVVTLAGGLRVVCDRGPRHLRSDTLIVPGSLTSLDTSRCALAPDPMLDLLRRAHPRRLASVCTGAFSLAAAGRLEGRRATTHWAWSDLLRRQHPGVQVDEDCIFVEDQGVWTSAGVSAGIDLALALVQQDCGPVLARRVAQMLVVFVQRPGGQQQFSAHLELPLSSDERISAVQSWMSTHLADDLHVAPLAQRAGMSERHFSRTFSDTVGVTPSRYAEALRVDEACTLLLRPGVGVEQAAAAVGFPSAEVMRRAFHRRLSTSPEQWRRRFASAQPTA